MLEMATLCANGLRRFLLAHGACTVQGIQLDAKLRFAVSFSTVTDGSLQNEMKQREQAIANLQVAVREALSAGRLQESLSRAKECMEVVQDYYGKKHPAYASAVNNLALVHKHMGQTVEAMALLDEALKCYEDTVGKQHISTAAVLQNLGLLHLAAADRKKGVERMMSVDEARGYLEEAFSTRLKLHGESHPLTAVAQYQLASASARQKRWQEAEGLCKEAVASLRKSVGDAHASTATALNNYGWILKERGQFDRAGDAYREAYSTRLALLGMRSMDTIQTQHNIAECLRAAGKEEEAQAVQRDILRALGNEPEGSMQASDEPQAANTVPGGEQPR